MAKRNKLALMSSAVSMAAQMIYLLVNFVLRRFFIQYFGMEILGINGVLADVLNTLSLADLGVQSAITFRMYEPLARGREAEVNEIITLFRKVYWAIGSFIILGGLCCMPFLPFLVTDVSYSMAYIRFAFFLQLFHHMPHRGVAITAIGISHVHGEDIFQAVGRNDVLPGIVAAQIDDFQPQQALDPVFHRRILFFGPAQLPCQKAQSPHDSRRKQRGQGCKQKLHSLPPSYTVCTESR